MKTSWKRKITSGKFWAAVTEVITALPAVSSVDDLASEKVVTLVVAIDLLTVYIAGKGFADSNRDS